MHSLKSTTNELALHDQAPAASVTVPPASADTSCFDELLVDLSLTPLINRAQSLSSAQVIPIVLDDFSQFMCHSPTPPSNIHSSSQVPEAEIDGCHTPASQLPPHSPALTFSASPKSNLQEWNSDSESQHSISIPSQLKKPSKIDADTIDVVESDVVGLKKFTESVVNNLKPGSQSSTVVSNENNDAAARANIINELGLEDIFAEYYAPETVKNQSLCTAAATDSNQHESSRIFSAFTPSSSSQIQPVTSLASNSLSNAVTSISPFVEAEVFGNA